MKKALLIPLLLVVVGPTARAQVFGGRQYYSPWHYQPAVGCYYRDYYFQETTTTTTYTVHQVRYFPEHPNYFYYYNPQADTYWGRVPVERDGKALYSLLAKEDRKSDLEEIPEEAFPEPSAPPPISG